jgi:hypothetical protein
MEEVEEKLEGEPSSFSPFSRPRESTYHSRPLKLAFGGVDAVLTRRYPTISGNTQPRVKVKWPNKPTLATHPGGGHSCSLCQTVMTGATSSPIGLPRRGCNGHRQGRTEP